SAWTRAWEAAGRGARARSSISGISSRAPPAAASSTVTGRRSSSQSPDERRQPLLRADSQSANAADDAAARRVALDAPQAWRADGPSCGTTASTALSFNCCGTGCYSTVGGSTRGQKLNAVLAVVPQ